MSLTDIMLTAHVRVLQLPCFSAVVDTNNPKNHTRCAFKGVVNFSPWMICLGIMIP